jgi:four helix bundle protein
MTSQTSEYPQAGKADELKARTKQFAVRCLKLIEALPSGATARVIASQLARSTTSVGANYRAACRARSRKEFIAKISITLEEADESQYWLELVIELELLPKPRVMPLLDEADQLVAIFSRSRATARRQSPIKPSSNPSIKESIHA